MRKRELLQKLLETVLRLEQKLTALEQKIDQLTKPFIAPVAPPIETQPYTPPIEPYTPTPWRLPIVVAYGCGMEFEPDGTVATGTITVTSTKKYGD